MIDLQSVSKYYKLSEGNIVKAVDDVNFQLAKNEFAIIFGRSGSGKTTLLSLIAGLTSPTKGRIYIDGTDINALNDKSMALLRNRKIGFIFQYPTLIPTLNVIDNVRLPSIFFEGTKQDPYQHALEMLEAVGLKDKAAAYPAQLSAGQMRRVQIARALENDPPLILADEPTGELDEATEREIMGFIAGIHKGGATMVMVTHTSELSSFANRLFKMESGVLKEMPR